MSDYVLLSIDIGTTHCKAGAFSPHGEAIKIASRPMVAHQFEGTWSYFDPKELLEIVLEVLDEVTADLARPIAAIGIASMAESGLLVDRRSGDPRSLMIPWFETAAQPFADEILRRSDPLEIYLKYGLRVNFKCSLAKILWMRSELSVDLDNACWLSAADYIAHWLTGAFGTDYSLACRTLAFRVDSKAWDADWLAEWGLPSDIFPPAFQAGEPIGKVRRALSGIPAGTPVSVCGHDHVCASLAMGVIEPGTVFDSMGTAETILGALPERTLTEEDFHNGLHYGFHVARGRAYWMGGLSASGGSLEWLRSMISSTQVTYAALESLMERASSKPTEILYFPYLWGSGSPHTDPRVRGSFIGLTASHRQEDLLKAVLEGVSYEMEFIRRAGEQMIGGSIPAFVAAGGGTRNRVWMQIKADVSGCRIEVSSEPEATLLGAAMAAGIGVGVYENENEAITEWKPQPAEVFYPNPQRHDLYQQLYEHGYLALQAPLRDYFNTSGPILL